MHVNINRVWSKNDFEKKYSWKMSNYVVHVSKMAKYLGHKIFSALPKKCRNIILLSGHKYLIPQNWFWPLFDTLAKLNVKTFGHSKNVKNLTSFAFLGCILCSIFQKISTTALLVPVLTDLSSIKLKLWYRIQWLSSQVYWSSFEFMLLNSVQRGWLGDNDPQRGGTNHQFWNRSL